MEEWTPAQKSLARSLFGRPARIALAAWIIERGSATFFQGEALDAVSAFGEARTAVGQELERFVAWGLIQRSEPGPSERRVFYAANKEEPVWQILRSAAQIFGLIPDD